MKIIVRAVGKMRDRAMEEICRDYLERVRRHLPVEVIEVASEVDLVRSLTPQAIVVALDPGGEAWDTAAFTKFLDRNMSAGTRAVVFMIGGAEGLATTTLDRAQKKLSLSKLTLPHRLARVVLCEQVYRCVSALRGEPYNK